MIYVNWLRLFIIVCSLLVFIASIWLYVAVGRARPLFVIPTRLVALIVLTLSGLLASLFSLGAACSTASHPLLSPDGKSAVRVIEHDEGATGGGEFVELYQKHGFHTEEVFSGNWKSTSYKQVHWLSNSELLIEFYGPEPPYFCRSRGGLVRVRCKQALEPY